MCVCVCVCVCVWCLHLLPVINVTLPQIIQYAYVHVSIILQAVSNCRAERRGNYHDALSSPVCIYVCMYICMYNMYIHPSQPETHRLHNNPAFSADAHNNKTLYLATIGHETAQHSTSSLYAGFRLLLTLLIAPVRATRLLAIRPYWLKYTTCTVLAQQGRASLCSSKYVGVDCPAAIQCFVWLAIPSF